MPFLMAFNPSIAAWDIRSDNWFWKIVRWGCFRIPIAQVWVSEGGEGAAQPSALLAARVEGMGLGWGGLGALQCSVRTTEARGLLGQEQVGGRERGGRGEGGGGASTHTGPLVPAPLCSPASPSPYSCLMPLSSP